MWDEEDDIDAAPEPSAKYVTAAVAILLMLWMALLGGCNEAPAPPSSEVRPIPGTGIGFAPFVWMDTATGCEYLSTNTSAALTPRIAADGKTHMGCKAAVQQ